jgi:hypothetical protein
MSNTGNQPPGGTPPASKPGDDDSPPSSQSGADAKPASTPVPTADTSQTPPASTPTPASTPPDSSSALAPASAPDLPPDSKAPDSKPPDSDGCAEIPTAAHAVLTAEIKLLVRIPRSVDEAQQMPHKFTLTSDDGSVNTTMPASSAEAGDVDGTSMITFTGLAEHHTYALQIDNGDTNYIVFTNQAYEQIGEDDDGSSDSPPADASDGSGGRGDAGNTGSAATT